ncbi:hypothetical protein [Enterococcus sp. AZ109]|uniref:hypothetical protein n=1 Tax=Enterococcus sp. AZ109 TaxID=2774634 RepID=UPI003F261DED
MNNKISCLLMIVSGVCLSACTPENSTNNSQEQVVSSSVAEASNTSVSTFTNFSGSAASSSSEVDDPIWTENKALDFLKNTMINPENAVYKIDDWSVYDGRGEWSVVNNEEKSIAVHWQYINGGGVTYQLNQLSDTVELVVFGGAFYPDRPDDKYVVTQDDYRIVDYTNLLLETAESTTSTEEVSAEPIAAAMNRYYQQVNSDSRIYIRQNGSSYEKEVGEYGWQPLVFDFECQFVGYKESPWGGSTSVGWWKEENGEIEFSVDRID